MSYTWSAGKKLAASLDHWSYYMIVAMEYKFHYKILEMRRWVPPRSGPLAEDIRK
ncbi:MAG: hypothetical protein N3G22_02260 [Candidatus Micrarchaeota archaeon]|nr:hypothetical protein [Candidatus Micrarchaeota archaeon]